MGMKRNTSTMGLAGMGGETSGLIMKKSSSEDDLQVQLILFIHGPYGEQYRRDIGPMVGHTVGT